jgi:hypothetical protein
VTVAPNPGGTWPKWWQKLRNDFRSAANAQENDGLVGPRFEPPPWIEGPGGAAEETLEAARRAHRDGLDRIATAEARASRLIQAALTLLALTLAVTGFEINRLRLVHARWWAWMPILFVSGAAVVCIALAVLQGIGVDRASLVQPADPEQVARRSTAAERQRNLVLQEIHGAWIANWTGRHKLNEFLQARAWLTRGIVALILTGLSALGVWTLTTVPAKVQPPTGGHECRTYHASESRDCSSS